MCRRPRFPLRLKTDFGRSAWQVERPLSCKLATFVMLAGSLMASVSTISVEAKPRQLSCHYRWDSLAAGRRPNARAMRAAMGCRRHIDHL